ncbi:MAG: hypothetical protein IID53_13805 [Proteobacteria bacterium]|nr:hypothetical protein [Pseudomonadota bacterium]
MATGRTKSIVLISFVAAVVALFLMGLAALGSLDEITEAEVASPNGGYVDRGKSFYTEGGSKWDGQGVSLVKSWIPFNETFATAVFRGYCQPQTFAIRWAGEDKLVIT